MPGLFELPVPDLGPGRDEFLVLGLPQAVLGHAGRLDNERLVWREDDNTVVVLGSSIAGFDEVTAADLVGRPWGGAALDPEVDVARFA